METLATPFATPPTANIASANTMCGNSAATATAAPPVIEARSTAGASCS